jgi:hypothetical protein
MSSDIFVRGEDEDDELEPRPALPCNDDEDEEEDDGGHGQEILVPTTAEEYLRMVIGTVFASCFRCFLSQFFILEGPINNPNGI